jgi:hypothetical protein
MANLNSLNWPYSEKMGSQQKRSHHPTPTVFMPGPPVFDKAGTYLMPGENKHPGLLSQQLSSVNKHPSMQKQLPVNLSAQLSTQLSGNSLAAEQFINRSRPTIKINKY